MSNSIYQDAYFFYMKNLSLSQVDAAIKNYGKEQCLVRKISKKSKYTIEFSLKRNSEIEMIKDLLIQNRKNAIEYGLLVKFSSNCEVAGLTIPKYIMNFHKILGGNIVFRIKLLGIDIPVPCLRNPI